MKAEQRQGAFLAAYRLTASITAAARACKIERDLHYRWMKEKEYREAFLEAQDQAAQTLEDEAVRRAHEGVFEPNVYRGQFAYAQSDYVEDESGAFKLKRGAKPLGVFRQSDQLLQFLLKGLRPDKYRDSFKGDVTVAVSGEVSLETQKLAVLTDDELARLIEIAAKLTAAEPTAGGGTPPSA